MTQKLPSSILMPDEEITCFYYFVTYILKGCGLAIVILKYNADRLRERNLNILLERIVKCLLVISFDNAHIGFEIFDTYASL